MRLFLLAFVCAARAVSPAVAGHKGSGHPAYVDPYAADRPMGRNSGLMDFDPTKFPPGTVEVFPARFITNGKAHIDRQGNYINKLGDGIPGDADDFNDDGIVTADEISAQLRSMGVGASGY